MSYSSNNSPFVEIFNNSARTVEFDFLINERGLLSGDEDAITEIVQSTLYQEGGFALAGRYDSIVDFISGSDFINLSGIDANDTISGNQAFDFVSTADFSGVAGELKFDPIFGLLSGDTNGDGSYDFGISLIGVTSLASSDILT